jgi:hypothetical protein
MKLSFWEGQNYRPVGDDDDSTNESFLDKEITVTTFQGKRKPWKFLKISLAISVICNLILVILSLRQSWSKDSKRDVVPQMYCECCSTPSVRTKLI